MSNMSIFFLFYWPHLGLNEDLPYLSAFFNFLVTFLLLKQLIQPSNSHMPKVYAVCTFPSDWSFHRSNFAKLSGSPPKESVRQCVKPLALMIGLFTCFARYPSEDDRLDELILLISELSLLSLVLTEYLLQQKRRDRINIATKRFIISKVNPTHLTMVGKFRMNLSLKATVGVTLASESNQSTGNMKSLGSLASSL